MQKKRKFSLCFDMWGSMIVHAENEKQAEEIASRKSVYSRDAVIEGFESEAYDWHETKKRGEGAPCGRGPNRERQEVRGGDQSRALVSVHSNCRGLQGAPEASISTIGM